MNTTTNYSIKSTATFCCVAVQVKFCRESSFSNSTAVQRLGSKMPTASEAAGRRNASRYDCGESRDTGTRTTRGLRRKSHAPNPGHDSYLERFQKLKQRKKNTTDLLQGTYDNTDQRIYENYGTKEASTQNADSRGSQTSGKPASEDRSHKTSRLCVVL